MFHSRWVIVWAALGANALWASAPFSDPAPPAIANLPVMQPPRPQAHSRLKFHAAPKPLALGAVTQDWPCFLGPTHNAVSTETRLLADFPASGPTLVWEVEKGSGYCAPAIWAGHVVMLHRIGDEEVVDCLEADSGKLFWHFAYPSTYQDRYGYCDGPRAAPVIDGNLVFTFGAEGKLHCLELSTGRLCWKRDLLAEFKAPQNFFGVGSTPLVEGDLLIVNLGAPGGPCVAAFDKHTGKLVWGAGDQWGPSYASPVPATVRGLHRIFVFAGGESRPATGGLLCIDPADGSVDFAFPWRARVAESVNASSPVILGSQLFISECYGRGGALLDLAAVSNKLAATTAWESLELGTHFMTAVLKDGYLYGVDGHGPLNAPLVCLDLKTGNPMWRTEPEWTETVQTPQGADQRKMGLARCSLLLVGERFLCLGEFGHLLWLDLSPKGCHELCRAHLFAAGESWTCPVLSHGLLYVCQNARGMVGNEPPRLLCYDLRGI